MQDFDKSKLASNVKRLSHLNIVGGGQVVVDGKYASIGSPWRATIPIRTRYGLSVT
jgi:hypothetical protein